MTTTPTAPEILSRLEGVKKTAAGWQARCPAHDDQTASLCIGIGDEGKVLIHCQAGCAVENVVRAAGLEMVDLMPATNGQVLTVTTSSGNGKSSRRSVAFYDYRSADGKLLYQAVRYEPKGFSQRQPKDGGGWNWNMKGRSRVLYRWPELLAADPGATVFIAEGEKDCNALAALGLVATCNVGGALKWRDEYSDTLRGRHAVVLPDNDAKGKEHAEQVATSLAGVAASVKVVELPGLPNKGDVSDWIAAGGTAEALTAIMATMPEWTPSCDIATAETMPGHQTDRPLIANGHRVGSGEDAELHSYPIGKITQQVADRAKGWPRRVGATLFVDDPEHGLNQFAKSSNLFGWMHSLANVVWYRGPSCVSHDELFSELQRTAPAYRAIESYPHFPPLAGHYYSHPDIVPGDGSALAALLGRFCPATPIDADLILAMFASAAWGGDGGCRPAFVIVSDDGRGVGKSKLIELLALQFGGMFSISREDKAADIVKRLLTAEAATKRVVGFDNVKANKISWAELESLITAGEISGHQMYRGERTRPNTLLWALTLNGPSMSRDMAQRSVVVKLSRPKHSGDWEDSAKAFIKANCWQIFADLAAFFLRPADQLTKHSRWGTWERDVLARLPEPADVQAVIAERQNEINADDEETATIEDHFEQELERLGYAPATDSVHIPNELARQWFSRATGDAISSTGLTRTVNQGALEGTLKRLRVNPCRAHGRGLLWAATRSSSVYYDVETRLHQNAWQDENRHCE